MKLLVAMYLALALLACSSAPPAPVEERSTAAPRTLELEPDGRYRVQRGDSLWMIAFHFGLDHRELARWNGIPAPFVIHPGQLLAVKQPPARTVVQAAPSRPVARTVPQPAKSAPESPQPTEPSQPAPQQAAEKAVATSSGSVGGNAQPVWQWPVKGRLLRGFLANNPARGGYDIAGTEGQEIVAAAAGNVVYSGSGLIGYGELIIIKHNDRLLSAYAHNRRRLVSEGEQVSAGQVIAEMGRNDRKEVMLHFEIRVDGRPVDPARYLPKP
ncbi:MAG: peptidoglycan DD-metalloendopeptidase family protein [Xanthomonadales bacterium]|nr:peptidoglycan DD-metalloendopeptidase family protein [Xanthomonadales bacterium]